MGFFSNLSAAWDLQKAAEEINNCFLNGLMPYLKKYGVGEKYSKQDSSYIIAGLKFIEDKLQYMLQRYQVLPADKQTCTMVRCADGHNTGVFGYIMSMIEFCQEIRRGL